MIINPSPNCDLTKLHKELLDVLKKYGFEGITIADICGVDRCPNDTRGEHPFPVYCRNDGHIWIPIFRIPKELIQSFKMV